MNEPRTIARYLHRPQAEVVHTALKGAGIPAFMADEVMTRIAGLYVIALGGIRIMVPDQFLLDAEAVLRAEQVQGVQERTETQADKQDMCPQCGSNETLPPRYQMRLRALSMLLIWLGFPVVMWARQYLCQRCKCRWEAGGS